MKYIADKDSTMDDMDHANGDMGLESDDIVRSRSEPSSAAAAVDHEGKLQLQEVAEGRCGSPCSKYSMYQK